MCLIKENEILVAALEVYVVLQEGLLQTRTSSARTQLLLDQPESWATCETMKQTPKKVLAHLESGWSNFRNRAARSFSCAGNRMSAAQKECW